MTTPARILFDVPRSHYDAITTRVNFSTLKLMAESPAHYRHAVDAKLTAEFDPGEDDEKSDTLLQGEATHVCVLEPDLYGGFDAESPEFAPVDPGSPPPEPRGRFAVYRGGKRDDRVKRYQAACARAKQAGQQLLTPGQHAHAMRVAAAVRSSPIALPLIQNGRREVTVLWDHVDPGAPNMGFAPWSIAMKTRIDLLTNDFIIDLKGARSAKPEHFSKQAWNLGYFHQAAMHQDAVKAATGRSLEYRWVVVENKAPNVVQVYRPAQKALNQARQMYGEWLARLHRCTEENEWPPYATGLMELDAPHWATPDEDVITDDVQEAA